MQDIIINRLRVLVNHLPFMNTKSQAYAIGKANGMLDKYFADQGKFIETDLSVWLKPPNNTVEDRQAFDCITQNCIIDLKGKPCSKDCGSHTPAT